MIQLSPSAEVQKVRSVIEEEMKKTREKFLRLKTKAESIQKDFVTFRAKLQMSVEKQKLSGKCNYIQ